MRLVLAVITFVLAAVLLAFGIGSRIAPEEVQKYDYAVTSASSAPVAIIDGATLTALEGRQTVTVTSSGPIVAAYARRADVVAWIGEATYNEIAFRDEDGEACAPDPLAPEACELVSIRHAGMEPTVPDPYGADLWMEDFRDTGSLRMTQALSADVAYLIASDGLAPAPRQIEIAWPSPPQASRELSAWLIIGGAAVGVIGLVLLLSAIHRMRGGGGGPKRRMPKVPKVATIKSVRSAKVAARPGGAAAVIAALVVGAIAFSPAPGAIADGPTPTPTPTPGTSEPGAAVPALDERQVRRIVDRAVTTVTTANGTNDAALAATRMTGAALELTETDYLLRSRDAAQLASTPVIPPDGEIVLSLPQQVPENSTAWPRRLLVVIAQSQALEGGQAPPRATPTPTPGATEDAPSEEAAEPPVLPPVAMILVQQDPRSDYRISYLVALQADIPEVPATADGTAVLPPDSSLVAFPIADVTPAYVDILVQDAAAERYDAFDLAEDRFVLGWGLAKQQEQQANQQAQESPNNMSFSTVAGEAPALALATTDGGALVFGTVRQTVEVTPAEAGAKVIAQGAISLLSGVERSERGYTSVYAGQLLFYVPPLDSDDPVTVLGYSGGIISSSERP